MQVSCRDNSEEEPCSLHFEHHEVSRAVALEERIRVYPANNINTFHRKRKKKRKPNLYEAEDSLFDYKSLDIVASWDTITVV